MACFGRDRMRRRRDRQYYAGYAPAQYYGGYGLYGEEYEDLRYDHVSVTRRRRRQPDCDLDGCPFCKGDYREPVSRRCGRAMGRADANRTTVRVPARVRCSGRHDGRDA